MLLTEEEAREKDCRAAAGAAPLILVTLSAMVGHDLDDDRADALVREARCQGSNCAMWRWHVAFEVSWKPGGGLAMPIGIVEGLPEEPRRGYCGLAGIPER